MGGRIVTEGRGYESSMDRLKQRIVERQTRHVTFASPDDPSIELVLRVPVDGVEVDRIRSAAERADKGKALNVHFSRALLAGCCESILIDKEPLTVDGEPVTFTSPALHGALGVVTGKDAVFKVLGSDGTITSMANRLMEEAGYGASDEVGEDPTATG